MLWVRGHFWQGELLLIINLFNLTLLYFRHPTTPLFVHIPIVSAPLAWNYVAILWNGAAMVHANSLPARIVANIFIWGILVLGAFFVLTFKDYTMGFELAILALGTVLRFYYFFPPRVVLTRFHSSCNRPAFDKGGCIPVDLCHCHCWILVPSLAGYWCPQDIGTG